MTVERLYTARIESVAIRDILAEVEDAICMATEQMSVLATDTDFIINYGSGSLIITGKAASAGLNVLDKEGGAL